MKNIYRFILLVLISVHCLQAHAAGQDKFVHPGIYMTQQDMEYMKRNVLEGKEPWRTAFENMKRSTPPDYAAQPCSHIAMGSYGVKDRGGMDIIEDSKKAYDCALIWYITGEEAYARKSIEIIDAWASALRSLDDNNAKLVVGLTGYTFCNAAEVLRYCYPGWDTEHTRMVTDMMMGVYYPMLRFYFSDANGNWDGAMMHSLLSIAVFTDNRQIFDNAIDHFVHGSQNGSLFKYIYPSGQCQETPRDQAHVQMGLCEFGGAARVAYTQGVDLFSLGDNRLALGFEYTMKFMMGETSFVYGIQSPRRIDELRDDYEYFYRHYESKGVKMPYTAHMCEKVRPTAARGVLTAWRAPSASQKSTPGEGCIPEPSPTAYPAGALESGHGTPAPASPIWVEPGASIQKALDEASGTGRYVILKAGIHEITEPIRMPSNVTLAGEGLGTVIMGYKSASHYAIVNAGYDMHDVTLSNFVIEGAKDHNQDEDPNGGRFNRTMRYSPHKGGISFLATSRGKMSNITLVNISVINFSKNGVQISGARNLTVTGCNFSDNGSGIIPGPKLHHNLSMQYVSGGRITDCRLDGSIAGCGLSMSDCQGLTVADCEVARNAWYGIIAADCRNIRVKGCLIEGNDAAGVRAEYLKGGCADMTVENNRIQYNAGRAVEMTSPVNPSVRDNRCEMNGGESRQVAISTTPQLIDNKNMK